MTTRGEPTQKIKSGPSLQLEWSPMLQLESSLLHIAHLTGGKPRYIATTEGLPNYSLRGGSITTSKETLLPAAS